MLFATGLTALACLVTLGFSSISDDSSKAMDGNQVPLAVDTDHPSDATLRACTAAPNCETYQSDHGMRIRFVAGHEPGSAAYEQRFGTKNGTMLVPGAGGDVPTAGTPRRAAGINTNIDMGDTKILYGTTKPYDGIHNIWDHCGQSSCDKHSFSFGTTSVIDSVIEPYTMSITMDAQYDGYAERAIYITGILEAASQGQTSILQGWHDGKGGQAERGTIRVYTQTNYISINRFSGGALQGFLTVTLDQSPENSPGWCAGAFGVLAAITSALEPFEGGFFGLVSAACTISGS